VAVALLGMMTSFGEKLLAVKYQRPGPDGRPPEGRQKMFQFHMTPINEGYLMSFTRSFNGVSSEAFVTSVLRQIASA